MNNTLINENSDNPYNKNFTDFDRYMLSHVMKNSKILNPFHLDCKFTNRKICYCKYNAESLITEKAKQKFSLINQYLVNYYSGITDEDYRKSFDVQQKFSEKVQYTQEFEDIFAITPKFEEFDRKEREKRIQQEEEQRIKDQQKQVDLDNQDKGECYLCKTKQSFKFYNIENQGINLLICHECTRKTHPELIPRTHLERGKIPSHLKPLKENFQKKKIEKEKEKQQEIKDKKAETQVKENQAKESNIKQANESSNEKEDEQVICNAKECKNPEIFENILNCKSCERFFHSMCLDPPIEHSLVNRFDWYCNECKLCIICWKNMKEDELLICDCCDRAFHMSCRKPKITNIPEGRWFCNDCEMCASCKKILLTNDNFSFDILQKYSKQTYEDKIICDSCWAYYKDKSYCPVCYSIIRPDAEGNYVQCDICQLWIHFECEQLSEKQIMKINQLESYTCKKCKLIRKQQEERTALEKKLKDEKLKDEKLQSQLPNQGNTNELPKENNDQVQQQQQTNNLEKQSPKN